MNHSCHIGVTSCFLTESHCSLAHNLIQVYTRSRWKVFINTNIIIWKQRRNTPYIHNTYVTGHVAVAGGYIHVHYPCNAPFAMCILSNLVHHCLSPNDKSSSLWGSGLLAALPVLSSWNSPSFNSGLGSTKSSPQERAIFQRSFILSPAVVATPFLLGILAHSSRAAQPTALLDYKHIRGQRGWGSPRLHLIDPMLRGFVCLFVGFWFCFLVWGTHLHWALYSLLILLVW